MQTKPNWIYSVAMIAAIVLAVVGRGSAGATTSESSALQDVRSLDSRVRSVEQRLSFVESSLTRLEQRMISQPSTAQTSQPELNLVRTELELMKIRVSEVECGVLKVDERTLPASAKSAQTGPRDSCRLNSQTPVQLSSRK